MTNHTNVKILSTKLETAVLAGGCFWCLEAAYQMVTGVTEVVSGYAGGYTPNPTYEQVASQTTGHAEVVKITFDTAVISYRDILDIFWVIHNPTTPERQGHDVGPEYRSMILYLTDAQKQIAKASIAEVQRLWPDPIVTEVVPLKDFYEAEAYHQNYYRSHPEQAYCQIVINPKLEKLREKFSQRLAH